MRCWIWLLGGEKLGTCGRNMMDGDAARWMGRGVLLDSDRFGWGVVLMAAC